MFQKSKAGVMVKTEHDKTHGTDRWKKKQTKITSETMMKSRKSRKNRFDKNQSINRGSHREREREKERRGYG